MGPFEEEEEGTGVTSDVVKVKGEHPTRGYGHYLTFLLPFSDTTGNSFTVQIGIPPAFCTFSINSLQTNVSVTVLVTKP